MPTGGSGRKLPKGSRSEPGKEEGDDPPGPSGSEHQSAMQIGEAEPCGVLLNANRGQRATLELMKAIDRAFTKYRFFGSRQIAAYLRCDGIVVVASCSPSDGADGTGSDLQTAENQPTAFAAQGLSLAAAGHDVRPAAPGLVFGHHLHPREARFSVSGCDYGLGDAESPELAVVEYDARRLLRRSLERGHRPLRTA